MRKSRKHTQLLAYLAGFFDGEGSIGIYDRGMTYGLQVTIYNDVVFPLTLLLQEFPGGLLRRDTRRTQGYSLRWNSYKAQGVLDSLQPYLLVKYEEAKLARSFLAHRRRDHRHAKMYPCRRCTKFVRKSAELKHRNAVNSVNPMREYRAKPEDVEADHIFAAAALEGVETRLRESNKANSAAEKDIVQPIE